MVMGSLLKCETYGRGAMGQIGNLRSYRRVIQVQNLENWFIFVVDDHHYSVFHDLQN